MSKIRIVNHTLCISFKNEEFRITDLKKIVKNKNITDISFDNEDNGFEFLDFKVKK